MRPRLQRLRVPILPLTLLAISSVLSGCALVGNVKPVAEKSESYGVMDLSKESSEWVKLDSDAKPDDAGTRGETRDSETTEVSDVAYQSKKNASIISLNSACRARYAIGDQNLRSFTSLLFLGVSDVTLREEKDLTVQGTPALETTVRGKLNREDMMFRTVVLRRMNCVYDLMYVARPKHFEENEQDFSRFVDSLRLK